MVKRALTVRQVEDALYCTSPTGMAQLVQHLHMRWGDFDSDSLDAAFRALHAEKKLVSKPVTLPKKLVSKPVTLPGWGAVELFALAGYGI